ncbi:hypothetical protein Avbf_11412 [Armadillidium vulgare]|nr:hypothetical protein Avbf_11412 [Armadillidium vulgare]
MKYDRYANSKSIGNTFHLTCILNFRDALLETSSSIRQDKASTSRADLDQLFPERITRKKFITKSTASSESSSPSEKPPSPVDNKLKQCSDSLKDDCIIGEGAEGENELTNISSFNIGKKSKPWFFSLSNKWLSLLGVRNEEL